LIRLIYLYIFDCVIWMCSCWSDRHICIYLNVSLLIRLIYLYIFECVFCWSEWHICLYLNVSLLIRLIYPYIFECVFCWSDWHICLYLNVSLLIRLIYPYIFECVLVDQTDIFVYIWMCFCWSCAFVTSFCQQDLNYSSYSQLWSDTNNIYCIETDRLFIFNLYASCSTTITATFYWYIWNSLCFFKQHLSSICFFPVNFMKNGHFLTMLRSLPCYQIWLLVCYLFFSPPPSSSFVVQSLFPPSPRSL